MSCSKSKMSRRGVWDFNLSWQWQMGAHIAVRMPGHVPTWLDCTEWRWDMPKHKNSPVSTRKLQDQPPKFEITIRFHRLHISLDQVQPIWDDCVTSFVDCLHIYSQWVSACKYCSYGLCQCTKSCSAHKTINTLLSFLKSVFAMPYHKLFSDASTIFFYQTEVEGKCCIPSLLVWHC